MCIYMTSFDTCTYSVIIICWTYLNIVHICGFLKSFLPSFVFLGVKNMAKKKPTIVLEFPNPRNCEFYFINKN